MTPRSQLVAGAWRTQVHLVDQAWRVFCYSCNPTLFSSGLISTWRVTERFFAEFFGFLFDNMSWCYLVFASLFPYSCALHLLFVFHVYALEQYRFFVHIYSCSALSLSQCKSNLAVIFIQEFEQALVIYHKSKLSIGIRAGTLFRFHYLSVILNPFLLWIWQWKRPT